MDAAPSYPEGSLGDRLCNQRGPFLTPPPPPGGFGGTETHTTAGMEHLLLV